MNLSFNLRSFEFLWIAEDACVWTQVISVWSGPLGLGNHPTVLDGRFLLHQGTIHKQIKCPIMAFKKLEVSTWEYNECFDVYKQSGSWILVATWHNSMSMTTDVYGWRLRALPWLRISSWTSRTPAWPACVPTWTPATTRTLSTAGSPPCSTWSLFASRRSSSGWTTGQATGEINLVQNHRSHLYRVFRHFIRCLVLQRVRPAGSARVETGELTENMISVERILYLFHSCD